MLLSIFMLELYGLFTTCCKFAPLNNISPIPRKPISLLPTKVPGLLNQ